jgi:hypothetical protein
MALRSDSELPEGHKCQPKPDSESDAQVSSGSNEATGSIRTEDRAAACLLTEAPYRDAQSQPGPHQPAVGISSAMFTLRASVDTVALSGSESENATEWSARDVV